MAISESSTVAFSNSRIRDSDISGKGARLLVLPQPHYLLRSNVTSAYPLMVFLVSKVNKRDLEAEQTIRDQ